MAINVFPQTGDTISEANWSLLNKALTGDSHFIAEGYELTDATGLTVTVGDGLAIVDGKLVENTGTTNKSLTASSTEYITVNSAGTIQARTSGWVSTEAKIGTVTTDGSSITSISHYRPVSSDLVQAVLLQNDQTKVSSTTLTSITDFEFDPGRAGSLWMVMAFLRYSCAGAGDIKLAAAVTNGSARGAIVGIGQNSQGSANTFGEADVDPVVSCTGTTSGAGSYMPAYVSFLATSNADYNETATVKIQFAQNTSNATATTIHEGSFMVAFRIA